MRNIYHSVRYWLLFELDSRLPDRELIAQGWRYHGPWSHYTHSHPDFPVGPWTVYSAREKQAMKDGTYYD